MSNDGLVPTTTSSIAENTKDLMHTVAGYKKENKELRKELLLLKVGLEAGVGFDQEHQLQSSLLEKENADLRRDVSDLREQCEHLVFQLGQQKDIDNEEVSGLQHQLLEANNEVSKITQIMNAEIEALRKQLNSAEEVLRSNGKKVELIEQEKSWSEEREELVEVIHRLNLEVSTLKNYQYHRGHLEGKRGKEDDNEILLTSIRSNDSDASSSDVSQLQSIIAMMRQVIDTSNHEREVLEQRLQEEKERSQMDLQAFAKTLEGVDDLRISAECMAREIRRIQIKGYRPTLWRMGSGGGGGEYLRSGGVFVRNHGELTAAVEASESMEHAIQMIEGMNDAMEERRRAKVAASAAVSMSASVVAANAATAATAKMPSTRQRMGSVRDDDDEDGGEFMSFWNSVQDDNGKNKKKKSKRKPKKRDGGSSVVTSFF